RTDGGWGWNGDDAWERRWEFIWRNPGFVQTDSHPVVLVSWNDARAFCEWLSAREKRRYHLPTEAEWEYACRAGSTGRFFWGENEADTASYANVADRKAEAKWETESTFQIDDGYAFTSPVGMFKPNVFGLYDMIGNAREWCSDWHGSYPRQAVVDPYGPGGGEYRVVRGGSFCFGPEFCRSASRDGSTSGLRVNYMGFRIRMDAPPVGEELEAPNELLPVPLPPGSTAASPRGLVKSEEEGTKELHEGNADRAGTAPSVRTEQRPLKIKNSIGMEFAFISPGTFMMGGDQTPEEVARLHRGKPEWFVNEHPQHKVTLTRGFYMATTEVTRGQFAEFVRATGYKTDAEKEGSALVLIGSKNWKDVDGANWKAPGFLQGDNHPVVEVSWFDAVAFCRWLGDKEKRNYRLPTEAEWEYACRAGSTTAYPWGSDPDGGRGWCNVADQTARAKLPELATFSWDDGYVFTAPVGTFKANAFGLYDTIGNVYEWCLDWYGEYTAGAVRDPKGPEGGQLRVLRGGSWDDHPGYCRSACRSRPAPATRTSNIGFRVCFEPE
ncbi:MAG TPA: SUMF1/EgtB/PvdO family nonheme iron enzyme, partial [Armatimonadota bacterium]|nr:SUMF1/EgtB/PvdO family nonheme iron enzyme [Armatimonadota bacterium]